MDGPSVRVRSLGVLTQYLRARMSLLVFAAVLAAVMSTAAPTLVGGCRRTVSA